jgi:hypothetical protein
MIEADEKEPSGGRAKLIALAARKDHQTAHAPISFDRNELNKILDEAVFSIFRRTSEVPLYRIVKQPKLARRQGAYSLIAATGAILKRGPDLQNVLRTIDRPVRLVVA